MKNANASARRPAATRLAGASVGLAGCVSPESGETAQATAFGIRDGRIHAICVTRNPDKLRDWRCG